jgi:16S rRNA C1402 (ribose-2'-O) methylase RsmI
MSTPTVADLKAATDATTAAIADPGADLVDVYLAAEAEEALYVQVFTGPCDREPEPEPEMEIEL